MNDSLDRIVDQNLELRAFLLRLLNPDDLGRAVTVEVRDEARRLLKLHESKGA